MSVSCRSQRPYDGTWYCVGKIIDRKSEPVMRTHSCGRRAPIGCMARKPGSTRSTIASVSSTSAMRGSVSYVAVSGGGTGRSTSHVDGRDLGVRGAVRGDREAVLEVGGQLAGDDRLPDVVDPALGVQGAGEPVQALTPPGLAEVVRARLVTRLLHQCVHIHGRQRTAYPARP